MASSTRITRSKGESDGLSLPMKLRSTRRDATSGRNGGTMSTAGWEHQQQMPTQMPHTTQSPETASAAQMATAPMLPPGPHRPLTPRIPLPALPASSLNSSAPLFQEEGYSSTSEEESEVTFTHGRCNGTSPNQHAERTSTPTPSDYTTQGDPSASPSGSSRSHDITNELLGTNNFFMPIQQQDPTEDTTTPAAPTEVEGPPSSCLRSKTKQQHTSPTQEQPERNPTPMDPPEHNSTEIEVNSIKIIAETYSWKN